MAVTAGADMTKQDNNFEASSMDLSKVLHWSLA